ncbi:MAG: alkaline phosphatase D family protein [Alphaproteobacteria bacterium]|nr:alkaline phosphatase D family protein [Alphaproteobacteria bacterium]MBU1514608.1 alkaline phosphatase D family protein [Alphaproteobacteria bacterium]MBU2096760.1 alkaline phosphatase D family protein [Alphaproteobacteria bacterium]MBU2150392.1 alkaline phosphatase D family protein [Alphaproteobacteria bacterium]MBU2306607.1 alkaline phosphatase D family protein [Alphaproteobacteria bacterium]
MKIDRRKALALLGLGAATPAAAQSSTVAFKHGVASGDPRQDRVVLWTRLTPDTPGADIAYTWKLNPIDRRAGGAKSGSGTTGPARDYTIKVDVTGLDAGRAYTYEFAAAGVTSPMGRTRTLPAGPVKDVVLAVASCTLYPNGYFNAYQAIADLPRVDVVLHLGDYIYEYGGPKTYGMDSAVAAERPHDPPHEILTLADYRRRHAQYKGDPAAQAAHARAPWIVVWDDHETANDSYMTGAQNHTPATEGDWTVRKAAALKAYFEWMPIREPKAGGSLADAAMRSFDFGDLASLIMVETRLTARDSQATLDGDAPEVDGKRDLTALKAKLADPRRRMMGPKQEAWIGAELSRSVKAGHAWQVIGNEVVMARVMLPSPKKELTPEQYAAIPAKAQNRVARYEAGAALGLPAGMDMWDGYPADRERLYDVFKAADARPIVVSGDSHSFWANELHDAAGKRVACEFGTSGITSPGGGELSPGINAGDLIAKANKEVLFNDQVSNGFVLLTLTREQAKGELVAVSTIVAKDFTTRVVKTFVATPDGKGVSGLKEV